MTEKSLVERAKDLLESKDIRLHWSHGDEDWAFRQMVGQLIVSHERLEKEVGRLLSWVSDLQAGMYINCVYCGHRYGPDDQVEATMADVLKEHIRICPRHPMSSLEAELAQWKEVFGHLGETPDQAGNAINEELALLRELEAKLQGRDKKFIPWDEIRTIEIKLDDFRRKVGG